MRCRNRPGLSEQGSTTDACHETQERRSIWKVEFLTETLTRSSLTNSRSPEGQGNGEKVVIPFDCFNSVHSYWLVLGHMTPDGDTVFLYKFLRR